MNIDKFYNHVNQDSEFFRVLKYLPKVQQDGPWLAGGSVWKAIENVPIAHDLDFFFRDQSQYAEWIRTLHSIPYVYRIVGEKANKYNTTYQFHVHDKGYNKTIAIQCISFKFWNDVASLIDGFDFTACQFAFDGLNLFSGETSFDDLRTRTIRFNKIHDTVATGIHLNKYVEKGFKIAPSEQAKFDEIMAAVTKRKNERGDRAVSDEDASYPSAPPTPPPPATPVQSILSGGLSAFDSYITLGTNSTATLNTTSW